MGDDNDDDHFSPNNGSSGRSFGDGSANDRFPYCGVGGADSAASSSPAFHTPEQQQPRASSGKKRTASELQQEPSSGGSGGSNGGGGGWGLGLGRLVMSFPTPWKSRTSITSSSSSKRPRTSLDDMSGSAIKRLVNQTEDYDDDDGGDGGMNRQGTATMTATTTTETANDCWNDAHDGGKGSGYMSDGVKTSETKLGKLNLEAKFDGSRPTGENVVIKRGNVSFSDVSPPQQQGVGGGSMVRIQQLQPPVFQHQQQQSLVQGSSVTWAASASSELPMKKRVRIHDGGADSSNAAVQSPYYHTSTSTRTNKNATTSTIHMGINDGQSQQQHNKSPMPLRNIHMRKGTPAGKFAASSSASSMSMQQRLGHSTAGSTPGLRRMAGTTRLHSAIAIGARGERGTFHAGTSTLNAPSTASVQRRFTASPNVSSRRLALATGFNYRHGSINARAFNPTSRLLSGANRNLGTSANEDSTSNGGRNQSMLLTESLVSQIIAENQKNVLVASSHVDSGHLFGGQKKVATMKRNIHGSEEDLARMNTDDTAGINTGVVVPRVRMNRILGSGQTGGRWHVAPEGGRQSEYLSRSGASDRTTNELAKNRVVNFHVPAEVTDIAMEDASNAAPTDAQPTFVPYKAAKLTPRATESGRQLTPCKCECEHLLSTEEGMSIAKWVKSDQFKQEAKFNRLGFDDPAIYSPSKSTPSPRKRGKRHGTPHPKKKIDASAISTPALLRKADVVTDAISGTSAAAATPAGAPYTFMSGGAAASSVVNTPMAFKFSEKTPTPAPPLAAASPAQGEQAAPPAYTYTSTWGDFGQLKPDEWRCQMCKSLNRKDSCKCLSCENPNPENDSDGLKLVNQSEPSMKAGTGAIGAGGFCFGSATSSLEVAAGPIKAESTSKAIPSFSGGLGNLFKLKPGEWKCRTCSCKNSANDSKCGDCGNTRDDVEKSNIAGGMNGAAKSAQKEKRAGGVSFGVTTQSTSSGSAISCGGFAFGEASAAISTAQSSQEDESRIGAGGFSFGTTTVSSSSGSVISSDGFTFGDSKANSTSTTPGKSKRGRIDASDDASSNLALVGGFNFGASATSTTMAAPSVGFSFSATSSGDEKKEDPVAAATTTSTPGGFSIDTGAKKQDMVTSSSISASTSTVSFGSIPQPDGQAASYIGGKNEVSEPSNTRTMFSFGSGNESSSAAGHGVSFSGVAVAKKDAAPSTNSLLSFGNTTSAPSNPTDLAPAFGGKVADSTSTSASLFSFGAPASTTEKKNDAPLISGQPSFSFGPASSVSSNPSTQSSVNTPIAPFVFKSTATSTGGPAFSLFSSGAPTTTSSTPAPSTIPLPFSTAGSMFGTVSNPPALGTMPGGFGSASQPALPAPVPTTPGTTFSFGLGSTSTPAAGGLGTAPATFGFGSATPTTAFGMNMAPNPTPGFAGNQPFGAQPGPMGSFTPQSTSGGGSVGSFSIGTGNSTNSTGRRIVKGKRPPQMRQS